MPSAYASGKNALGICDRCGFTVKLLSLQSQPYKGRPTGWLVCRSCLDKDHPQLWQGTFPIHDPQALKDPRSDAAEREESRTIPD